MTKKKNTKKVTQVEHHRHVRSRPEPFPSKSSLKRVVDRLVFIAGPLIPVAIAPTAWEVAVNGNTEGVNLITWGTLMFTSAVMATYAYIHREWPLILTYTPLFILNVAIVLGVVLR